MYNPPYLKGLNFPYPTWMEDTKLSPEVEEALKKATLSTEEVEDYLKKFDA